MEEFGRKIHEDAALDEFTSRLSYVPTGAGPAALADAVARAESELGGDPAACTT